MNKNKMKSVKQVVIGMLLLGSVNVAYAQTTDSTKQSQPTDQVKQQDNNALVKEAIAYQDKQDWNNALATWKKLVHLSRIGHQLTMDRVMSTNL